VVSKKRQSNLTRWQLRFRDDGDLSANAKLACYALGTYADTVTGRATPSVATLAKAMSYGSEYSVRRALRAAREARYLYFEDGKGGQGVTVTYWCSFPESYPLNIGGFECGNPLDLSGETRSISHLNPLKSQGELVVNLIEKNLERLRLSIQRGML
jgi:hypothetical protein